MLNTCAASKIRAPSTRAVKITAPALPDLEHDTADRARKIACPVLALWAEGGNTARMFDVIATWQARAAMKVTGKALPGRHFLPEEAPEQTLAALQAFLNA
ncbi:MAG: hypothetical protein DMG18_13085 [Acidobacteria bacterium]|nr:MAG: hypothetical protein DMG18_13085 [Acidobacteriota bacterium]